LYYCNGKSEYGQCGDLLYGMKKKILLSYYEDNKEEINDWLEDKKEAKKNAELKELKEFKTAIIEEGKL
jgi:TfoX/Sxy family transcriptional regulator of competence genes